MDLYCVMGNPVEHSRSPWIHTRFAELTGQALCYGRRLAPLDGFAATVHAFAAEGGRGCNVTTPFKFEAEALAAHLTPRAREAGACNTLRLDGAQVLGDNTDGIGLVRDIEINAQTPLTGQSVLLLGAGGAAAGVLGPLLATGPRRLVIANRTVAKAQALAARHAGAALLQKTELQTQAPQGLEGDFDVIVNATASSLTGAAVPVTASVLKPGALAYDMMYGPAAKTFMDWAAAHGARARDGLGMLVEQAAESFEIWRGVRPPVEPVLAELRTLLARTQPV